MFSDAKWKRRRAILLFMSIVGFYLLLGFYNKALGITSTPSVDPLESDNFYEACGKFWADDETSEVRGILVLLQGTDSDARRQAESPFWREIARHGHLGLLGVYFRGEDEPYEDASKGSGAALLKMVKQVAASTGLRNLDRVPLLLIGHSAGAMFAFNFTVWAPERVAAFVAVKTGPITPVSIPQPMEVPGLFIVGNHDIDSRVQTAAKVFTGFDFHPTIWSFAVEPNAGHEWTQADD